MQEQEKSHDCGIKQNCHICRRRRQTREWTTCVGEICGNLRFDSYILLYVFCRLERDLEHEHKVYMIKMGEQKRKLKECNF